MKRTIVNCKNDVNHDDFDEQIADIALSRESESQISDYLEASEFWEDPKCISTKNKNCW